MIMETALPEALRTFCRGVLHAIGMFDPAVMTEEEKTEDPAEYRTWFCLGETGMAALLALNIAVPAGFWFAGIAALPLAFIGAAVLFLPIFVFLPRIIRYAMKADTDAVMEAFGKNEQVKKVFWALFIATAGLVLAEVVDPATAQQILAAIMGAVT
jgi:F0F1-type ATP synthase assembly protein I